MQKYKKLGALFWLVFISLSLQSCITYRVLQIAQASAVVDSFYQALNAGNVAAAIELYAPQFRKTAGDDLLKENLGRDMQRLGAFLNYQVKGSKITKNADDQRILVLTCQVAYQKGATLEVFVIELGGSKRIASHEIKKERLTEGEFLI